LPLESLETPWIALLLWHVAVSGVAFAAYGIDKGLAARNLRRIPEKRLHTLSLLGGWPGALAGQQLFRHKRAKSTFMRAFWGTVAAHIVALIMLVLALTGGATGPTS
jgi:uncharacterized membrane protein YsdA (DUF1294 family)